MQNASNVLFFKVALEKTVKVKVRALWKTQTSSGQCFVNSSRMEETSL